MKRLIDENGSMAPLMIGLAMLSIALTLTVSTLGSAFIFQRRLVSLAEAKALSAITQGPEISNTVNLASQSISSPDGQTVEVRLCAQWSPPFNLGPLLAFAKNSQLICGSALSRLGK